MSPAALPARQFVAEDAWEGDQPLAPPQILTAYLSGRTSDPEPIAAELMERLPRSGVRMFVAGKTAQGFGLDDCTHGSSLALRRRGAGVEVTILADSWMIVAEGRRISLDVGIPSDAIAGALVGRPLAVGFDFAFLPADLSVRAFDRIDTFVRLHCEH